MDAEGIAEMETMDGGNYSSAIADYFLLSVIRARAQSGDAAMQSLLSEIEEEESSSRERKFGKKRGSTSADHEGSDLEGLPILQQLVAAATGLISAPTTTQEATEAIAEAEDAVDAEKDAVDDPDAPEESEHLSVPESESPGIPLLQEEVERIVREVETIIQEDKPDEMYRMPDAQQISEAIKLATDSDGNVHIEGVIERVVGQLGGRGKAAIKARGLASELTRIEANKAERDSTSRETQELQRRYRI